MRTDKVEPQYDPANVHRTHGKREGMAEWFHLLSMYLRMPLTAEIVKVRQTCVTVDSFPVWRIGSIHSGTPSRSPGPFRVSRLISTVNLTLGFLPQLPVFSLFLQPNSKWIAERAYPTP